MLSDSLISNDPECIEFVIKRKRKRRTNSAVDPCLGFYPPAEISICSFVESNSFSDSPLVEHNPPAIEPQVSQLARTSFEEDLGRAVTVEDFLRRSAPVKRRKRRHIDLGNKSSLAFDADKTSSSKTSTIKHSSSNRTRKMRSSQLRIRSGNEITRKSRTRKRTDGLIRAAVLSHVNVDTAFQTTSKQILPPPLELISVKQLPPPVGRRCRWKLVNPKKTTPFDRELPIIPQSSVETGTVPVPLKPMTSWKPPLESRYGTQITTRTASSREGRTSVRPKYPPIQFVSMDLQTVYTTDHLTHRSTPKRAICGALRSQYRNHIESAIFEPIHASAVFPTIERCDSNMLKHPIKQVRFSSPFRSEPLQDALPLVLTPSHRTSDDQSILVTPVAEDLSSPKDPKFSSRSVLPLNMPSHMIKQPTPHPSNASPNDWRTAKTLEETSADIPAVLPIICSSLTRSDASNKHLDELVSRSPTGVVSKSVVKPMKTLGKFFDTFMETARQTEASVSATDTRPSLIEAQSKLDVPTNYRFVERNRSQFSSYSSIPATILSQNNRRTFSHPLLPVTSVSHTSTTNSDDSYARRSAVKTLDSRMLPRGLSANSRGSVGYRIKSSALSNLDLFNNDSRVGDSVLFKIGLTSKHDTSMTAARLERQRKRRELSVTGFQSSEKERLETEERKKEMGVSVNFFGGL